MMTDSISLKRRPFVSDSSHITWLSPTVDFLSFKFNFGNNQTKGNNRGHFGEEEEERIVANELQYFLDDNNEKQLIKKKKKCCTLVSMLTLLLTALIVVAFLLMTMIPCTAGTWFNGYFQFGALQLDLPRYYDKEAAFSNKTFNIVLLGDSLMNRPYNMFNLAGLIQGWLPGYNLNIINCGSDGQFIGNRFSFVYSLYTYSFIFSIFF